MPDGLKPDRRPLKPPRTVGLSLVILRRMALTAACYFLDQISAALDFHILIVLQRGQGNDGEKYNWKN